MSVFFAKRTQFVLVFTSAWVLLSSPPKGILDPGGLQIGAVFIAVQAFGMAGVKFIDENGGEPPSAKWL